MQCRFDSCPTQFAKRDRPVRLSVQDASLSRWQGGFDSRTGHAESRVESLVTRARKIVAANILSGSRLFTLVSRLFHGQVVQQVDTRRSERRARTGLGVRLSPWSIQSRERRVERQEPEVNANLFWLSTLNSFLSTFHRRRWTRVRPGLISLARRVQLPNLPLRR